MRKLVWDAFNKPHVMRHGVTQHEVKEACLSEHITLQTYGERILLVGKTNTGKLVSVVLSDKGDGVYYPVTARSASRKERRYYQEQKGGEKAA